MPRAGLRLRQLLVVVGDEVDGVLVQTGRHQQCGRRRPGLGA